MIKSAWMKAKQKEIIWRNRWAIDKIAASLPDCECFVQVFDHDNAVAVTLEKKDIDGVSVYRERKVLEQVCEDPDNEGSFFMSGIASCSTRKEQEDVINQFILASRQGIERAMNQRTLANG